MKIVLSVQELCSLTKRDFLTMGSEEISEALDAIPLPKNATLTYSGGIVTIQISTAFVGDCMMFIARCAAIGESLGSEIAGMTEKHFVSADDKEAA